VGFVSHDKIALIEIPPSRQQIRLALTAAIVLCAATLLIVPYGARPLARTTAFVPMADAILLVGDLVAATLLFAQASVLASRALIALASGFVFTAVIVAAHALTFPGSFTATGLLGAGPDTTVWIVFLWTAGFPLAVCAYALLKRMDAKASKRVRQPFRAIKLAICATVTLAVALCAFATFDQRQLPPLMINNVNWDLGPVLATYGVIAVLIAVAMVMVWRQERSVLDMWLLVALFSLLLQMVLNVAAVGRFTLAWYFSRGVGLFEHLLVVLVLLAETSRMYTQSALSLIALKRERESRLMSMYAVATAMAHEVRQPLTGVALQAAAAIARLDKRRPDRAAIAKTLTAIVEDSHRASEVIASIRDVFAHQSGQRTELDLNELVRETLSLMQRELSAQKISLNLALHEPPPFIFVDRVQLQEVLVNLVTNAIESLGQIQVRQRKMLIQSSLPDHENVLLEISDSGLGIEAEQMARMFEAFFTTKKHGTGMGLALCRSIVEAHGGRLWATPREDSGITLHLQLPNSVVAVP
jgi:signal transduction histidine kinase